MLPETSIRGLEVTDGSFHWGTLDWATLTVELTRGDANEDDVWRLAEREFGPRSWHVASLELRAIERARPVDSIIARFSIVGWKKIYVLRPGPSRGGAPPPCSCAGRTLMARCSMNVLAEQEARSWLAAGDAEFRGLLYHGTPEYNVPSILEHGMRFSELEFDARPGVGTVWLTDHPGFAARYGEVLRLAVRLRKPLIVRPGEHVQDVFSRREHVRFAHVRELGYDGIVKDYAPGEAGFRTEFGPDFTPRVVTVYDLAAMRVLKSAERAGSSARAGAV